MILFDFGTLLYHADSLQYLAQFTLRIIWSRNFLSGRAGVPAQVPITSLKNCLFGFRKMTARDFTKSLDTSLEGGLVRSNRMKVSPSFSTISELAGWPTS